MKKKSTSRSAFFNPHALIGILCLLGVLLVLFGFHAFPGASALAQAPPQNSSILFGESYHNDISPALRDLPVLWPPKERKDGDEMEMREANLNPKLPHPFHVDAPDQIVDRGALLKNLIPDIPSPILNFDGIPFPGVGCNCAPPDTNGAVGQTQYVQIVNKGYQVFNKTTGGSILGPLAISSVWTGFGGVCETSGFGDPVVLYDHLANRWLISQFAGTSIPTTECIAISTTSDATGSYARYGFTLGTDFFDYPKFGVWPDGYYMSMDVFNPSATAFLGPQAFAFDRGRMLAGLSATFVTPGITGGPSEDTFRPSDLDGSITPATGTANPFVSFPGSNPAVYKVRLFHADFVTPGNTTFNLIGSPPAAGFTLLCPTTRACVPQLAPQSNLDGLADRLMFRLAYRKFLDGHEAVVGNYTVSSGGVAGVRWFELRAVTVAPVVFQESTYQPDTTWRWMGSAAMDKNGDLAIGFSASSAAINPQIRYAGRLVNDPINTLGQGEATLFSGTGSQSGTSNRWGDYSSLSVDPVDDCTFWYTQEYYATNSSFNWRTRIGNFKFAQCTSVPTPIIIATTSSLTSESCAPANNALDPNETVTVSFCVQNVGTASTSSSLTGTLLNTGGVTGASAPQNYGVMAPGATVCRPFTFTATGNCGGALTATIHFQDGATDLGNVTYNFTLGTLSVTNVFSESFDGVVAPALPAGWTTAASGVEVPWVTSTTNPSTAPNDAFAPDPTSIGNTDLVTPTIAIPMGASIQLTFRNLYNMESTFDGMVLEISINGGAFQDITAGGGGFATGGYTATISTAFGSPIAGRMAWTGLSGGTTTAPTYITTVANLPPAASGQNIRLKWRAATDNSATAAGAAGVRIDAISLTSSSYVCCNCGNYAFTVSSGSIVPGTVDVGNHIDDGGTVIALPFSYTLYDQAFTSATVGSNGHVTFGTAYDGFGITCLPEATATYAIGPYWTDQCTGPCGNFTGTNRGIFTSTSGTAPNRIFNIEYRTAYYNSGAAGVLLNYEVRLFEGQTAFDVIYGTVNPLGFANDSALTVGVQKSNGAGQFTSVGCDPTGGQNPFVSSGQRYHYTLAGCAPPTPTPSPTATATATVAPTPTPTPTPPVSISGTVVYCSNPVPGPVPNVTMTRTGTTSGSTLTNASGNYSFTGLPSGGNYTVTPTKAARPPGSANINTTDVIATQRHFLNIGTPLSGCRLMAADVNGDTNVNTTDVIAIQRFFLGLSTGIANVGKYKFTPVSRPYTGLVTNQTGQNYDTLVFGDTASSFVEVVDNPEPTKADDGTRR